MTNVAIQFAYRLMLIGFATVMARGVLLQASLHETAMAALGTMLLFFPVGLFIGELARILTEEVTAQDVAVMLAERDRATAPNTSPPPES